MHNMMLAVTMGAATAIGSWFRRSTPERFWNWFKANANALERDFQRDGSGTVGRIVSELDRASRGLTCVIGPTEDGRREIVISADGIRDRIPAVQALVDCAPDMPGWCIVAFRPRIRGADSIHYGPHTLGPGDVWFRSAAAGNKIDLELYIRGLDREEALGGISFLLLDNELGEYDVMTRIGHIDHFPLPFDPVAERLRPLSELASVVDSRI